MLWCRYGLIASDSDDEAEVLPPQRTAAEKGKAAAHPVAQPAKPSQPRRGFNTAQLQVSSSDDEADILEGRAAPPCLSQAAFTPICKL